MSATSRCASCSEIETKCWLGHSTAPRRSQMLRQMAAMHALELLEADELARFAPDIQESIAAMAELFSD